MQIVIDIPEEEYEIIKACKAPMTWVEHLIKNGTPLPKGHGALIDVDVLCEHFWDNRSKLYSHKDLQIVIDRTPTIIEADKAESEIHCNCTDEEIAKSFIEDVEAVKDLLPRTESEGE